MLLFCPLPNRLFSDRCTEKMEGLIYNICFQAKNHPLCTSAVQTIKFRFSVMISVPVKINVQFSYDETKSTILFYDGCVFVRSADCVTVI